MRLAEDHTMAIQVGRSVVSFTIKNIDAREKLKREIDALLNRGKDKKTDKKELTAANENERATSEEKRDVEAMISSGSRVNPAGGVGGLAAEFTSTPARA